MELDVISSHQLASASVVGRRWLSPFACGLRASFPVHPPVEGVVVGLNVAPVAFDKNTVGIRRILSDPVELLWIVPVFANVFLLFTYL